MKLKAYELYLKNWAWKQTRCQLLHNFDCTVLHVVFFCCLRSVLPHVEVECCRPKLHSYGECLMPVLVVPQPPFSIRTALGMLSPSTQTTTSLPRKYKAPEFPPTCSLLKLVNNCNSTFTPVKILF